jgi:hypothetical protein
VLSAWNVSTCSSIGSTSTARSSRSRFGDSRGMEDDGPPRDWLGEISEMLVNGGYFRARMTSISAFDKVRPAFTWRDGGGGCTHKVA